MGEARRNRDGQQVFRLHIEALSSPCKTEVEKLGLGKCHGNIGNGHSACFNENKFVVGGSIGLGQLVEHLIDEIVEQNFGGMVQLCSEMNHMGAAKFSDTACSSWVVSCCFHLINVDVAVFIVGNREGFILF